MQVANERKEEDTTLQCVVRGREKLVAVETLGKVLMKAKS